MLELLYNPLMHNALTAGLLIAATFSLLGIFVALRQSVFVGVAMTQAASAGVAFALLISESVQSNSPIITWFCAENSAKIIWPAIFTILAVCIISAFTVHRKLPSSSVIAVVYLVLWALAILFVANSGHGVAQVRNLVEGDLLMVSDSEVIIITIISVTIWGLMTIFWKNHVFISFDKDMASALGFRPALWTYVFYIFLGTSIVISIPCAGLLSVFTWMVIPPSAGLLLGRTLKGATAISISIAVVSTITGLALSLEWDYPVSPLITISSTAIAVIAGSLVAIFNLKITNKHKQ